MDGFFQDNDNGMTPKEKKRLYIGLFIFIVLFMSLIIYLDKSQFMKIRNPFKDYLGRWKDDVTTKEKLVWGFLISFLSYIFFRIFIFISQ